MGVGSHDNRNGVADSPCYQNDGIAQLNTEGNVAVPQVMDTNIRQIGELGAAGQLLVERCARHVEYAVVWGQPVEPGTVGAELFGQPMRNRHMYRMKKITAAGVWEKVDEGELTKAQALRICGPRPKES